MKTKTALILTLTIIITLAAGIAFGKYSGGTGEPNTPYQIATKADLLVLAADANDYNKCFILTADINMEGQVFTMAIIAPDTTPGYPFQGTAFTGTFDGNNRKITNFTINGGNNAYLGLFGYITSGSVKNLGLDNYLVSGSVYVGGLVGVNGGNISNCHSMGSVSGVSSSFDVGGLVGSNGGSISNCCSTGTVSGVSGSEYVGGLVGYTGGTISNCYSTGTVSIDSGSKYVGGLVGFHLEGSISDCYSTSSVGGFESVGGLVGYNSLAVIGNCYSTGSVSGSKYVGGLVGNNWGNISNCYSAGSASSYQYVGGLAGFNAGTLVGDDSYGNISNCYSTGSVSGTSYVGGFLGDNYYDSGIIVSCFWDTQISEQATSSGGTGKTTAQMKTLSTFTSAGWDFASVWTMPLGQYPMLWLRQAGDLNYDGRVDFVDFALFADHWLNGE